MIRMKRIAVIFLSLFILFPVFSCAEEIDYGLYDWSFRNGVLKIEGEGELPEGGPWNDYFVQADTLELGEGITSFAFSVKKTRKSIPLARMIIHGRTKINTKMLEYSKYLKEIQLAGKTSMINWEDISKISRIKNIVIADPDADYDFVNGYLYSKDHTILYYYCGTETSINLPEGVKIIDNGVFYKTDITDIVLPSTLTEIGSNAFEACKNLTNIIIPENVLHIGDYAFYKSGLEKVKFMTEKLEYPYTYTTIDGREGKVQGKSVFSETKLRKISLPGCGSVHDSFFADNRYLEGIVIGEGTEAMPGAGLFKKCPKLKYVYIPATVVEFGDSAFEEIAPGCVITCEKEAPVIEFAEKNGIKYEIIK